MSSGKKEKKAFEYERLFFWLKPIEKAEIFWAKHHRLIMRILVVVILGYLLYRGIAYRHKAYKYHLTKKTQSPDLAGFVSLAKSDARFFMGWREPGCPLVLRFVNKFVGDYEKAWRLIGFWSSVFLFLGACYYAYAFFGPFEAMVVAFFWYRNELIIRLSGQGYREDLVSVFLLVSWILLLKRRWALFVVFTIVGSYMRITNLTMSILSFLILVLFGYIRIPFPLKGEEGLWKRIRRPCLYIGILLLAVLPLLIYYKIKWGSFFYPQKLILYDGYIYYKTNNWFVNVSGGSFFNYNHVPPKDFSYWQCFTSFGDFLSKMGNSVYAVFWGKFTSGFFGNFLSLRWIYMAGALLAFLNKKTRPHFLIAFVYSFSFIPLSWISDLIQYRFFCVFHVFTFLFIGYFLRQAAQVTLPGAFRSVMGNEENSFWHKYSK